ncbi:hypothetical protein MNBD_GAMMA22-1588 [hydrothermal vent metagenome]|uniref:DUF6316 domain-containing protein n=1 Tax=hydrothermal vent metagenome TaxID=652676 RepID=A0A3B1AAJ6_9ZZZZ
MGIDNRSGESENIPFRTGRFYNVGSNWYFSSREQADLGPFLTKEAATQALLVYLQDIETQNNLTIAS